MPTYPKTCKRSGRRFMSAGPAARYCGKCTECKAEERAPKAKAEKPETRRTPANTGFVPSSSSTRAGSPDEMIADLKKDLEQLDARREHLTAAIDALIRLEAIA